MAVWETCMLGAQQEYHALWILLCMWQLILVLYTSGSKHHLDTCLAYIAHSNKLAELACEHMHVDFLW